MLQNATNNAKCFHTGIGIVLATYFNSSIGRDVYTIQALKQMLHEKHWGSILANLAGRRLISG